MRIVFCPGVFDLTHEGHENILQRSRGLGDYLIAGVVSDDGTEAYKGRRPVQPQEERLANVWALPYVDLAVLQGRTDPTRELLVLDALGLRPQVLTHGSDWTRLKEGNATLLALGIEFVILPYTPGISTTMLREAM